MRPIRRDDDEDGGLDSLLDTMTNVVGILVLVLIVTQLGVSDALQEITSKSNVTAEDVELAREELASLRAEQEELAREATSGETFDIDAAREELRRKRELLETRKALLEDQKKEHNEYALQLEQDRQKAKQNRKEIEETEQTRKTLQAELLAAQDRRDELKALLDETPQPTGPPPETVITIPDPKPAPPGAKAVIFVCQGNRLYPMNLEAIRKDAELRAKALILRLRLNRDPKVGIDPEKFADAYTKLKYPTDDFFEVEYYVSGNRWPRMRLTPKEGKGATEKEIRTPGSRVQRLLSLLDPEKYYARFFVKPDSFEVYLTTRELLTGVGMLAGWEPVSESWTYTSGIGGGIELGPPRPKDPNPKPPAKPANVID